MLIEEIEILINLSNLHWNCTKQSLTAWIDTAKQSTCRGWKKDNIDMSWKHDNYFFPNNTPFSIINIVHFIKDNLQHNKHEMIKLQVSSQEQTKS